MERIQGDPKPRDSETRCAWELVRALLQNPLSPLLDDAFLRDVDPRDGRGIFAAARDDSKDTSDGPSALRSGLESRRNAPDFTEGENKEGDETKVATRQQHRQVAFGRVLLAHEVEFGSSNTVVNDLAALALPNKRPLSEENSVRTLVTSVNAAALRKLSERPLSSLLFQRKEEEERFETIENDVERSELARLIRLAYPRADRNFVAGLLENIESGSVEAIDLKVCLQAMIDEWKQKTSSTENLSWKEEGAMEANPSAFLSLAVVEMQLNSLEHTFAQSDPVAAHSLLFSTCNRLADLFQAMPLGSLSNIDKWEQEAFDNLAEKLVILGERADEGSAMEEKQSSQNMDSVDLFLLGLGIQRSSLLAVASSIKRILRSSPEPLNAPSNHSLKNLLMRLSKAFFYCPLVTRADVMPIWVRSNGIYRVPNLHLKWHVEVEEFGCNKCSVFSNELPLLVELEESEAKVEDEQGPSQSSSFPDLENNYDIENDVDRDGETQILLRDSICVSRDGRFIFVCGNSVGGVVKAGTGNSVFGASPALQGHVTDHFPIRFEPSCNFQRLPSNLNAASVILVRDEPVLLARKMGSSIIQAFQLSCECNTELTRKPVTLTKMIASHRLSLHSKIAIETLSAIHNPNYLKVSVGNRLPAVQIEFKCFSEDGGNVSSLSWVGLGDSWVSRPGHFYFEVTIVGSSEGISFGWASPAFFDEDRHSDKIGSGAWLFHAGSGHVVDENGTSKVFGMSCRAGDVIGCGLEITHDSVEMTFVRNGISEHPAFRFPVQAIYLRPCVVFRRAENSVSSQALPTPSETGEFCRKVYLNCGFERALGHGSGKGFEHFPSEPCSPVAHACDDENEADESKDDGEMKEIPRREGREDVVILEQLGPVPPMAFDGTLLYCLQIAPAIIPSSPGEEEILLEVLDPESDLESISRHRFKIEGHDGMPDKERFWSWRVFTNGDDLVIVDEHVAKRRCAVLPLGALRSRGSSFWRHPAWPGDREVQVSTKVLKCEEVVLSAIDSYFFSRVHNAIYTWCAKLNTCKIFENEGFPSFEKRVREKIGEEFVVFDSRTSLCVATLNALARLVKPFLSCESTFGVFGSALAGGTETSPMEDSVFAGDATASISCLVDILRSLRGFRAERSSNAALLNEGMFSCLEIILYVTESTLNRPETSSVEQVRSFCTGCMQDKNETEAVRLICAKIVLQTHLRSQASLTSEIGFILDELKKIRQDENGVADSQAYICVVLSGLVPAISSELLSLGFIDYFPFLEELIREMIKFMNDRVQFRLRNIEKGNNFGFPDHLCDSSVGFLVALSQSSLSSLLINAEDKNSSQVFRHMSDLFRASRHLLDAVNAMLDENHGVGLVRKLDVLVMNSIVGRVLPVTLNWLEFILRSKNAPSLIIVRLFSEDRVMQHLTKMVDAAMRYSARVSSGNSHKNETSSPTAGKGEKVSVRRRSSTLVAAAAFAGELNAENGFARDDDVIQSSYHWIRVSTLSKSFESKHNYENDLNDFELVVFEGAHLVEINFDPQTSTEKGRDFVRFMRAESIEEAKSLAEHETLPLMSYFGKDRYSGSSGWPGTGSTPPLRIEADRFVINFSTDSSDVDWGYKFTASARIFTDVAVPNRSWRFHFMSVCRDVVAAIIQRSIGGKPILPGIERRQLRWIQNPVFSGGLLKALSSKNLSLTRGVGQPNSAHSGESGKSDHDREVESKQGPSENEASNQVPKAPLRSRSGSLSRLFSMSEDDREQAQQMLLEMLSSELPFPGLGGAFFTVLRAQRVPLDQGFFTHRAVAALGAALVKVNGLEKEALRLAKAHLAEGNSSSKMEPPSARLLKIWSYAQYVRTWADQLVVNGQVQHHVDASVPKGSPLYKNCVRLLASAPTADDPEEPQYCVLCDIVAHRASFVLAELASPVSKMLSIRTSRKDAARARWHRLRRHFCPKTQQMLQHKKRWDVLLGALRALNSLRAMVAGHRSAAQKMAMPLNRNRGFSTSSSRERRLSRDRLSSQELPEAPADAEVPVLRLVRSRSSQYGVDAQQVLSARSTSSTGSSSGAFNFKPQPRRRERTGGGLRRSSFVEVDGDVDLFAQEHDQSLSESITTFLESGTLVDCEGLRKALQLRNERAYVRLGGLQFVNAMLGLARSEQRFAEARALFETVLLSTSRALRGADDVHDFSLPAGGACLVETSTAAQMQLFFEADMAPTQTLPMTESHYLTDLSGCSYQLRYAVELGFGKLLQSLAALLCLTVRQHKFAMETLKGKRIVSDEESLSSETKQNLSVLLSQLVLQMEHFIRVVSLDYVESDFVLLASSGFVLGLKDVLFHDFRKDKVGLRVQQMASKCFDLILRRCVCEGGEAVGSDSGRFLSGSSLQQSLLDVLLSMLEANLSPYNGKVQVFSRPQLDVVEETSSKRAIISDLQPELLFAPESDPSFVGEVITTDLDFTISFEVVINSIAGDFRAGRLFSIGNPQVESDAIGLSTSQYISGPPDVHSRLKCAWIELSLDSYRRIVVTASDYAGVEISVISEYALPNEEVCRVAVSVSNGESLRIDILSIFAEDGEKENLKGHMVFTVEEFPCVFRELGHLSVDLRRQPTRLHEFNCGEHVRVAIGQYTGLVGIVLGAKDGQVCVWLVLSGDFQDLDNGEFPLDDASAGDDAYIVNVFSQSSLVPVAPGAKPLVNNRRYACLTVAAQAKASARSLLAELGFEEKTIQEAIRIVLETENIIERLELNERGCRECHKHFCSAPIYLGSCPTWGLGAQRAVVRGVCLRKALIFVDSIVGCEGTSNINATSHSKTKMQGAPIPSPVEGGVVVKYPLHLSAPLFDVDNASEGASPNEQGESIVGGDIFEGMQQDVVHSTIFGERGPDEDIEILGTHQDRDTRTLETLLLVQGACSSPVGRARLTAPYPLAMLLRTCVSGAGSLEVRISCEKILETLLLEVTPLTASDCAREAIGGSDGISDLDLEDDSLFISLIMRSIGLGLAPKSSGDGVSGFGQLAESSSSISRQLIRLIHQLCNAECWRVAISEWIKVALQNHSSSSSSVREILAALAVLGGEFEAPKPGERALMEESNGLCSKAEVVVLSKVPLNASEDALSSKNALHTQYSRRAISKMRRNRPIDITARMKVQASTDQQVDDAPSAPNVLNDGGSFWESSGYTPHWIQVLSPKDFVFHSVEIFTNSIFDNYSPENVEVRVGPAPESLRSIRELKLKLESKWVTLLEEGDVRPTDRVFRLDITSNHSGGCDTRIQRFRILARRKSRELEEDKSMDLLNEKYFVRHIDEQEEESNSGKKEVNNRERAEEDVDGNQAPPDGEEKRLASSLSASPKPSETAFMVTSSLLKPVPLSTPLALLDNLPESVVEALMDLLNDPSHSVEVAGLRARASKCIGNLLQSVALMSVYGEKLLAMLVAMVPMGNKASRERVRAPVKWALSSEISERFRIICGDDENDDDGGEEQKEEPKFFESNITFVGAEKRHRIVSLNAPPMISGKHSWEIEVLEDSENDETALVGITTLAHLGSDFALESESESLENLLKPSKDFWLLQAYNGHRLHRGVSANWEGAQTLRFHPGDIVRLELDMEMGTLSVGVNEGMPIRIFYGIRKEATWGVFPCVGSYGNLNDVKLRVKNLRTSLRDFKSESLPQRHLLLHGSDQNLEERAARTCELFAEGYGTPLADLSAEEDVERDSKERVNADEVRDEDSVGDGFDCDEEEGDAVVRRIRSSSSSQIDFDALSSRREQSSGVSCGSSQRLIQKINTLYEVADSSADQDGMPSSPLAGSDGKRERDVHALSLAMLSDPRFLSDRFWFGSATKAILDEIARRNARYALEKLLLGWLAFTSKALPPGMFHAKALEQTVSMIFRSFQDDPSKSEKGSEMIAMLCEQEEDVSVRLLELCNKKMRRIGKLLSSAMERERLRETDNAGTRQKTRASRFTPSSTTSRTSALHVGDMVRARFMSGREWYHGRISMAFSDGTYGIDYDDGDTEVHVPRHLIEVLDESTSHAHELGDRVFARFRSGAKWYSGLITSANGDSTFDIQYDDGDFERGVPASRVSKEKLSVDAASRKHAGTLPRQSEENAAEATDGGLEPGESLLLIADRYRGDIPPNGKPDSAQVSIINCPSIADGYVKFVKLRLAEPPAGSISSWEVLVFERAGDTSTFFVVTGTPTRPTRGTITFDPNSTNIQTVPVEGRVFVSQGQYIGVLNPEGRLNVAYTPGKKKIEESWELKPVEVFYLMPKNVPVTFEGGPHRTRKWHGRAGWCATMVAASSGTSSSRQTRQVAEDVFIRVMESGLQVEEYVRQSCWVLTTLLQKQKLDAMRILSSPGLLTAIRRICEHGIFTIDGDSKDGEETSSALYQAWLPLIELISNLCAGASMEAAKEQVLPRKATKALIHMQAVLEGKVHDMNETRQKRLKDILKSKVILSSSNAADAAAAAMRVPYQARNPPAATVRSRYPLVLPRQRGLHGRYVQRSEAPSRQQGVNVVQRDRSGRAAGSRLAMHRPTFGRAGVDAMRLMSSWDLAHDSEEAVNSTSRRLQEAPAPAEASNNTESQQQNNAGDIMDAVRLRGEEGVLESAQEREERAFTGIRFQRLLRCLVQVDDLTRKDGLDGEPLLVDSPRRAAKAEESWVDVEVKFVAQHFLTPHVLSFEVHQGRLCISKIRSAQFDPSDKGEESNMHEALERLMVGDELIAVEGTLLAVMTEVERRRWLSHALSGLKDELVPQSDSSKEHSQDGAGLDFSKPYEYNGIIFPRLEGFAQSSRGDQSTTTSTAREDTASDQTLESLLLAFRRRQSKITQSEIEGTGKGTSYRGVRGSFPQRLDERTPGKMDEESENDKAWLDSLVTATELLKAFACRDLPPARFLREQLVQWSQKKHRVRLESSHPIFEDAEGFSRNDGAVQGKHTNIPVELSRRLSRQRTHSRLSEDDEDSEPDSSVSESLKWAFQEKPKLVTEREVSINGAAALKLAWDPRSCLKKGRNDHAIVLHTGGHSFIGQCGLPPSISVVEGSNVRISVAKLVENPALKTGLPRSSHVEVQVPIAGLQNRAAAYLWLGSKQHCKAKFYCGRHWSEVVGWSQDHKRCGPLGDHQCPDCAAFQPRNMRGRIMVPGHSQDPAMNSRMVDILYCDLCGTSSVPCIDCRLFLAIMSRTDSLCQVPFRKRSSFSSNIAYGEFLASVVVPGMPMRLLTDIESHGRRTGDVVVMRAVGNELRCMVVLGKRSLSLSSSAVSGHRISVEMPLYELELLSAREYGGKDERPRRLRAKRLAEEGSDRDEDDRECMDDDQSTASGSLQRFLESSDFASSAEYARYMVRNCHVGDKVRCSRRYESVEEGDIGDVLRIDDGDDLPCQVLWSKLGAHYWLPWDCLSLNLTKLEPPSSSKGRSNETSTVRASKGGASTPRSGHSGQNLDDLSVHFSTTVNDSGIELYNNSRSITRNRNDGWGTQRLNCAIGRSSDDKMNVYFQIEDVAGGSSRLMIGVITVNGFGGPRNESETITPMSERGAWALRRNGALYVDGVEVRPKTRSKRINAGEVITLSLDAASRSLTLLRGPDVIDTISGLPAQVVPAVSLYSSTQRVSIRRVERGDSTRMYPIADWGYSLSIEPAFDGSTLTVNETSDRLSSRILGKEFNEYLRRQSLWSRKEDERLVAYVNAASSEAEMDLKRILSASWEELLAVAPIVSDSKVLDEDRDSTSSGPLASGDPPTTATGTSSLPSRAAIEAERTQGRSTNLARQRALPRGFRPRLHARPTLPTLRSSTLSIGTSTDAQTYVDLRRRRNGSGRTAGIAAFEAEGMKRQKRSAAVAVLVRLVKSRLTALGLEKDVQEKDEGAKVRLDEDLEVHESTLDEIIQDIAQRFDVVRALNSSVHDALALLDLSGWKDPRSAAAQLSECAGLLFDKFKLPLWQDAISSTKAEDIHKFEVVLDFGKAMSKRHLPDLYGRHTVFAQAFRIMHPMPPKTLRAHGKLYKCVMRGMASHDDGGPYRQSFQEYCNELQSLPGVGLLLPCSNRANEIRINRDRWLPNPAATSPVQISMFEFLGKLMGIAIRNVELLDLRLPSLVWKPLVNQVPAIDDLRAVDVLTVNSIEAPMTSDQDLYFTAVTLDGRENDLVPNGSLIKVTPETHADWARRTLEFKIHEFDVQMEAIRRGLATIVPQRLLMLFRWDELELMVCGQPKLDLALLKKMTVYSDCSESDNHVQFFWEVLESMTEEQKSGYLKFVWGRSRLPVEKEAWEQPHKIAAFHPPRGSHGRPAPEVDTLLPYAHTCYFTIDLPRYSSSDILRRRLLYAIENCLEIDGDQTTTGRRAAAMGFDIDESDDDRAGNGEDSDDELFNGFVGGAGASSAAARESGTLFSREITTTGTSTQTSSSPSPPPPPVPSLGRLSDRAPRNLVPISEAENHGLRVPNESLDPEELAAYAEELGDESTASITELLARLRNLNEDPFGEFMEQ